MRHFQLSSHTMQHAGADREGVHVHTKSRQLQQQWRRGVVGGSIPWTGSNFSTGASNTPHIHWAGVRAGVAYMDWVAVWAGGDLHQPCVCRQSRGMTHPTSLAHTHRGEMIILWCINAHAYRRRTRGNTHTRGMVYTSIYSWSNQNWCMHKKCCAAVLHILLLFYS